MTPGRCAISYITRTWVSEYGLSSSPRASTPMRRSPGTASLRIANTFPEMSFSMLAKPVTFPPGRDRLLISPPMKGSAADVVTTGIVPLALAAARTATVPSELTRTRADEVERYPGYIAVAMPKPTSHAPSRI